MKFQIILLAVSYCFHWFTLSSKVRLRKYFSVWYLFYWLLFPNGKLQGRKDTNTVYRGWIKYNDIQHLQWYTTLTHTYTHNARTCVRIPSHEDFRVPKFTRTGTVLEDTFEDAKEWDGIGSYVDRNRAFFPYVPMLKINASTITSWTLPWLECNCLTVC